MTQKEALDILKTGQNVFLTGAAGSGKTYVLNAYISHLRKNNVEVGITASTGIAATHMGGVTIHSWSGLGIRDSLTPYDIESLTEKEYLWKRFDRTKVLVIDEVSMLHHYRLDMVDKLARVMKRDNLPFGGMQIVLCGDFFQLPPVTRPGEREAYYAYRSEAWHGSGLKVCYLEEQHRQSDDMCLEVLNSIRRSDNLGRAREILAGRHMADISIDIEPTRLYTHNADVDTINKHELSNIDGDEREYFMTSRGRDILVDALKKSCLAPERLALKRGARVMFVKNNFEEGYVNGTLGVVEDFDEAGYPVVRTADSRSIVATEESWTIEDDGKVKAEIAQIPLRLAWAITVHKSQGMSLDAVETDLSRSFAPGMGYVALSRVRTIGGLRLLGLNEQALHVDKEVLLFDENLLESSKRDREWFRSLGSDEAKRLQKEFVELNGRPPKEKKRQTYEVTRDLVLEKLSIPEMARRRGMTEETIVTHLEKLISQDRKIDLNHLKPHSSMLDKVGKAFKKAGDGRLTSVHQALGNRVSFLELKIARLFLDDRN